MSSCVINWPRAAYVAKLDHNAFKDMLGHAGSSWSGLQIQEIKAAFVGRIGRNLRTGMAWLHRM